MMPQAAEIGAFSEEHAQLLTGITRHQLRRWDRQGFFRPSYEEAHGQPFGRVYSFWDIVALRVLNELRNEHGVSLQHLKQASSALGAVSNVKWGDKVLYVFNKRVAVDDEGAKRDLVSGQYLSDIIRLKVVISSTRQAIRSLNERGSDLVGQVTKSRFVEQNDPVLAGTRVRVAAVKSFKEAGYSVEKILEEYPSLTSADVNAALAFEASSVSA